MTGTASGPDEQSGRDAPDDGAATDIAVRRRKRKRIDRQREQPSDASRVDADATDAPTEPAAATLEQIEIPRSASAIGWLMLGSFVLYAFVQETMMSRAGFSYSLVVKRPQLLFALGALERDAVLSDGEFYRILASQVLHSSFIDVVINQFCIALAATKLEKVLRPSTMVVLLFSAALGGSLGFLLFPSPEAMSVGPAGVCSGLVAASLLLSFRFPHGEVSASLRRWALLPVCLFAGMLLFLFLLAKTRPDVGALITPQALGAMFASQLLGGAAGAAFAELLVQLKKRKVSDERLQAVMRKVATGFAVALGLCLCAAALRSQTHIERLRRYEAGLTLPERAIPADPEVAKREVDSWGKGHESDPRVRHVQALRMLDAGQLSEAEIELRDVLVNRARYERVLGHNWIELGLRASLAQVLLEQGRNTEALQEAAPVCTDGSLRDRQRVKNLGLCE